MKKIVMVLCLLALVSARASAELKYTMHMEVKKGETPGAQGTNPMMAMMGDAMMKQLLPAGAADMVYVIGEKGARIEYLQAAMGQPEGTVTLALPDGTLVVLNPKDQTYWKTTTQNAVATMQAAGIAPQATAKATGQFDTVAGLRCEVVAFEWKMDLPIPESARASMPPDFPTSLSMSGDSCVVKDQFQKYAELSAKNTGSNMMASMGLDKIAQGGIVLRQNMRMAGVELSSVVTKIGEEDVPAGAFEIPAGYKEVPAPTGPTGIR
jgi:hypothetical protein